MLAFKTASQAKINSADRFLALAVSAKADGHGGVSRNLDIHWRNQEGAVEVIRDRVLEIAMIIRRSLHGQDRGDGEEDERGQGKIHVDG